MQLLPPVESFYADLKPALSWWIDENSTEATPPDISHKAEEKTLPRVHFPEEPIQKRHLGTKQRTNTRDLDQIRYAARNRLCIEINYHNITRLIEPYSLRQSTTGKILLYAHELKRGSFTTDHIKAYDLAEITHANLTHLVFSPRYAVEL